MRSDMKKVVVERPRWGSRQSNRKFSARLKYIADHDYDEQPKKAYGFESHMIDRGGKYFAKEFTDVLSPLQRYLHKQVGRPWDKVYSEICEGVDRRKTTGRHIFQHLQHMVDVDCYFNDDGKICCLSWGKERGVRGLYVHPRTGLLSKAPRESNRKRKRKALLEEEVTRLPIGVDSAYWKHDGIWYLVKIKRIFVGWNQRGHPPVVRDIFSKRDVALGYGDHEIAVEKKQCSRFELARINRLLDEREKRISKE